MSSPVVHTFAGVRCVEVPWDDNGCEPCCLNGHPACSSAPCRSDHNNSDCTYRLATPDECAAHAAAQRHLDVTREIAAAHPVPLPTGATDWRAVALEQAKRLRDVARIIGEPK